MPPRALPACYGSSMPAGSLLEDARRALAACATDLGASAAHASMRALLADAGELAFHRGSFLPGHFTASAFVVGPREDELLLVLHAKLARWLQPGGHVEPGDASLLDAARRELAEETGIAEVDPLSPAPFDLDVHRIPAGRAPEHLHFDVRYLCRARSRVLRPATDALDARWAPLDELDSIERDESVARAVRRLRARRDGR